jgi:hypothetical protein
VAETVTLYGLRFRREDGGRMIAELVPVKVQKTPRQYRPSTDEHEAIKWNSLWSFSSHLAVNGTTLGREYSEDPFELVNRASMRLDKKAVSLQRELDRVQENYMALVKLDVEKIMGIGG